MSEAEPHTGTWVEKPEIEYHPEFMTMSILDIGEVSEEEKLFWQQKLIDFLSRLSPETLQSRFGAAPNDALLNRLAADYARNEVPRKIIVIEDTDEWEASENHIIGAATLANYDKQHLTDANVSDGEKVVELAITIADEAQGKGIGTILFQEAIDEAIRDGVTHLYTSTNLANEPIQHLLGEAVHDNVLIPIDDTSTGGESIWRIASTVEPGLGANE